MRSSGRRPPKSAPSSEIEPDEIQPDDGLRAFSMSVSIQISHNPRGLLYRLTLLQRHRSFTTSLAIASDIAHSLLSRSVRLTVVLLSRRVAVAGLQAQVQVIRPVLAQVLTWTQMILRRTGGSCGLLSNSGGRGLSTELCAPT